MVAHLWCAVKIGIHTSTVQHAIEIRSSWIVEDGYARPLGSPKVKRRGPESTRAKIARELQGMDAARAEIARRIAARGPRHRSRR